MASILTAEDVAQRIAAECAYVDERGGVGIRLEPAAAIVRRYGEQLTISRRQQPHSADGTSASTSADPSARRHAAHRAHANQNHRSHYPFKPAVPSESGQVAQNLVLNPHRPTLPPAHTPPRFPPSRLFGRLPPCSPSRSDWQASENP
jgi:hypothetical protein